MVEALLRLNQKVVGLDDFSTGHISNLEDVRDNISVAQRRAFRFVEGDITDPDDCKNVCRGVDYALHQAAVGSVPRSFADPLATHVANTTGYLNIVLAARDAKTKREAVTGQPLSPYAVSKVASELYASVFSSVCKQELIGLRYFNVFGPRQNPQGAYAAVIPRWILTMLQGGVTEIYGDGKTSRDFCFVANVVQANLLAAMVKAVPRKVYNVAIGAQTNLKQLHRRLRLLTESVENPIYREFRAGDMLHSLADVRMAQRDFGYCPTHTLDQGLDLTVRWFRQYK